MEYINEVHNKLVNGIKSHLAKAGFKKAVIGLSGGIDSSVVACIAVEATGKENVLGVLMPGPYSSEASVNDAKELCRNLCIKFEIIPIDDIFNIYLKNLQNIFKNKEKDTTEENLQARIRANILMALSNKFGYFVLNTGNKSEAMVGYCTLYGDSIGGLAVISDVYKTDIYKLAKYINKNKEIIPEEIIKKEPSAELSPGQKDTDALPPYEILDEILKDFIDKKIKKEELIKKYDKETVEKVIEMHKNSEFKRQQCPPGINV